MRHRRRMKSCRHRAGYVCDVGEHPCAYSLCDLANAFEIYDSRIGRCAADQQFWLVFFCNALQLVVINLFCLSRDTVIGYLVAEAREVHRMAVREVATM